MIIDQLPTVSLPVQNTDEIPIERGQQTFKASVDDLNKVSKSGDTMTGSLEFADIDRSYAAFVLTDPDYGLDSLPSATIQPYMFAFRGEDLQSLGFLRGYLSKNGESGMSIMGRNVYNGSGITNSLLLTVKPDGTRIVTLSHPSAWRSALGFGSNDALPISLGGTGATDAATARTNLGLSSLQVSTDAISNNASKDISMPSSTHGFMFMSGAGSCKGIFAFNVQSNGLASHTFIGTQPSGITITNGTNKFTVANSSGAAVYLCAITY